MFQDNLEISLMEKFKGLSDFSFRELNAYKIFFISSLVKKEDVNKYIIEHLLENNSNEVSKFPVTKIEKDSSTENAENKILRGNIIVSKKNEPFFWSISLPSDAGRSIESSDQEFSLYTSLESFTEQLDINLTLIRRFLPTADLKSEIFELGKISKSQIALLQIEGLANEDEIELIKEKMKNVDEKFIINSAFLGRRLENSPFSSFPQYQISDRPDLVSLALSSGKIVLIIDQNPFALIGPVSFLDFFESTEDYIYSIRTAFLIRILRLIGYIFSIMLVPLYVAITTHDYEALPLELLFIIIESRSDVPFTPFWESILMLLTLEILKEASKRMPTKTGNTLGVVGGIIIGDAAIQAGIASNVLIVIIGITAVSSFVTPNYLMGVSSKIIRLLFLVLSFQFGLYGVIIGFCFLIIHLNSIYSIKKPYLMPSS
ncbi:MAG: spore germination protein [Bacillota bacterium]